MNLLLLSSCINIPDISPPLDLERGACNITLPDREICVEVTLLSCFDSMGEYIGDGSTCDGTLPNNSIATTEPSPIYLDQRAISAVGGALTVIAGLIARNIVRKRRKKHGTK